MPKAVVVKQTGDINALEVVNVAPPKPPGPGQVLIRQTCIGVNYMDIYYRSGIYKAKCPFVPGMEAVGVVEAVGAGCEARVGQRVAYATVPTGAYCEKRLISEKVLVGVPDDITDEVAAASLGKGLAAHYLLYRTYRVKKGDTILLHAAAGATGQIILQWAKKIGARVIGTVGSQEKATLVAQLGCDHPIIYTQTDFVAEVNKITGGKGVPVAYDSVGKDTFAKTMQCLSSLGLLVTYGQSSGPVPPLNVLSLAAKGIFITRPTLMLYKKDRMELILSAIEVYNMIMSGKMKVTIDKIFSLDQAAEAHQYLQNRQTKGSVILKV
jgi:NADPH2:quinone reductase